MSLPSTEDNVVSHAPDADPAWRGLIRGSAVIAIGLTFELGFQFARTIILARLLGATEFGLVASINVLIAIVDMATFIGTDRYLVFTPDGGRQHTLDVAHTLTVLRGLICSAATFILAVPTASLLGAGDYWAGFAIISITPLIRSAAHLGVVQVQRSNCFWPSALTDSAAMLLGLLAAVIAAFVAPDHRAIIWGLCAQATGSVVFSHILARKQPYRFSFDREPMREALRFGLPLMGNGLALAAVYQLDRIIVGAWLGVAVLGLYGLGVTLMLQPITLLLRLSTTLLQPRLSRAWHSDRSGVFEVHVRALGRFSAILGGAGAVATACVGAPLLRLVFGASYTASDIFFVMMAGIVFVRFSRGAVNLLGLSIGQTSGLDGGERRRSGRLAGHDRRTLPLSCSSLGSLWPVCRRAGFLPGCR